MVLCIATFLSLHPEVVNCAYCGGDAGGGICNGIGPRMIGYQGCPCSTNDGGMPPYYRSKVCPEDFERPTQKCGDPECDDDKFDAGICSAKRFTGEGGIYRHCSCCPRDEELFCEDCGGDDGDAKCLGIPQYRGTQYQGCLCTPGSLARTIRFLNAQKPDCADALCEGNNDEHKCTVEFGTEKNKDCTCFQLFKDMEGERPFSDAEIDAQQTFIDNLINDKSEGCVEGFTNSTVLTIETTGNFISLYFEPDVFPEMFENGNSQWRIVDITGFAKEWLVRFHPSETIAGTSTDGRVTFDFDESIQAIERVSIEAPLPFEADGSCPTTIKIAVDAACAGNLPAEPEIAEPNRCRGWTISR
ncbi:unnamed protein product [Parascedosporium putredinis]|uniref:Uncharacterized protein n=1 Tax=Parascedosporium putredinis TaxID=1442378 RepID=A0A9P1GZ21_9PEZI|nr:unnamed protein product [Parascedosporium putredinis]CAI7992399.1 unnamed protein product [Parascedosporium putredinis]